jgi:hypothetical protein
MDLSARNLRVPGDDANADFERLARLAKAARVDLGEMGDASCIRVSL